MQLCENMRNNVTTYGVTTMVTYGIVTMFVPVCSHGNHDNSGNVYVCSHGNHDNSGNHVCTCL